MSITLGRPPERIIRSEDQFRRLADKKDAAMTCGVRIAICYPLLV